MVEIEKRITVCLVLEGSYPYITGGVSAWVQDLIIGLSDIDFKLFTISPKKEQPLQYKIPPNVVEHRDIVLGESLPNPLKFNRKKIRKIRDFCIKEYQKKGDLSLFIPEILINIPEGYSPLNDLINSDKGWELIVSEAVKKNPVYSFSDYYWAWKSSYDLLFNIMSRKLPEADLYHAVSTGFAGVAALGCKLRYHKPMLLCEHGLYHKEREMEIRNASFVRGNQRDMWINMYYNISRACYEYADIVTSLFELTRQYQIKLGAESDKCYVTPNGIDTNRFNLQKEKREGFHIGLVGRVVPIKDIKTFIKTAKVLSEKIENPHFYCIGPTDEDPRYFEECKHLVKNLGLETIFTFTGKVDVTEYYKFLDVLMLTSIREAQPLVILEGWLSNIPAVATKVGNVQEMLEYDERLLASPKDFEKLAEAVLFVYHNPERVDEISRKNRMKVLNFYNKEKLHNKYRNFYKRLSNGRNRF